MDFQTVFLIFLCTLLFAGNILQYILLHRYDTQQKRLESYLLELNELVASYKQMIDGLFEMEIHYYDEIVHEFVERTKTLKAEIDKILEENGDLADYIYPDELKEQPKEVLGVIKAPSGRALQQ